MPTEPQQDRNVEARASELRECPFCGSQPSMIGRHSFVTGDTAAICCDNCQVMGPWKKTVADAIAAWNSRPSQPPQNVEASDAAKGAVEAYRIQQYGDGAGVWLVNSWRDVISRLAECLYSPAEAHDFIEAGQMLTDGLDGSEGWNGNYVKLNFEDGEFVVERLVPANANLALSTTSSHGEKGIGERQGEVEEMARAGEGDGELAREIKELLAKHDDKHIKGVNCHYCCSWREDAFKLIKEHATAILDASSNAERLRKAEGLLGELIEHHQASENAVYSVDSKPITAAKRFLAPPDESSGTEGEGMWLIERGQAVNHSPTIWWCGGDKRAAFGEDEMKNWTVDASKARRFKTWEEAKSLAQQLFGFGPPSKATFTITEHVFI